MTTATPTQPGYLERADNLLAQVQKLGELSEEQTLSLLVSGSGPGRMQEARLNYAATLALCSIARSLELLASPDRLELGFVAAIGAAIRGHEVDRHE